MSSQTTINVYMEVSEFFDFLDGQMINPYWFIGFGGVIEQIYSPENVIENHEYKAIRYTCINRDTDSCELKIWDGNNMYRNDTSYIIFPKKVLTAMDYSTRVIHVEPHHPVTKQMLQFFFDTGEIGNVPDALLPK